MPFHWITVASIASRPPPACLSTNLGSAASSFACVTLVIDVDIALACRHLPRPHAHTLHPGGCVGAILPHTTTLQWEPSLSFWPAYPTAGLAHSTPMLEPILPSHGTDVDSSPCYSPLNLVVSPGHYDGPPFLTNILFSGMVLFRWRCWVWNYRDNGGQW